MTAEAAPGPAPAAGPSKAERVTLGTVVLTMGDRPDELNRLLRSVADQEGAPIPVVVVANGGPLPQLPEGATGVALPENVGIPAGRNVGTDALREDTDVVLYLDDDGRLAGTDAARLLREAFAANPRLGIVSFRIVDPDSGETQRRHVPRVRVGDPLRSGPVTTFLGGASAVRGAVLREVGGLPDDFFYAHEETDLAWRALDAGWEIEYRSDIVLEHPKTSPARHAAFFRMNARNRVYLARRNLPWPLVPAYLGTWVVLTAARRPSKEAARAWAAGFREGWQTPSGPRKAMSWRTVWRMTRLGRPPVI
ncbi:glycosyltransferase family 2 protein [Streptomyces sp. SID3343]|uniref:glycosyltransferase family 2 protein n=1 Tax=Streptomyces sp. SID3343 TaxID=2690260 RepID=UPI00136976C8|nr:glycosyltransferase family 2 protein [Streptomyces sp. SID3343]MYW06458.1 glycosyltransferase [Streptomyces sp. SID3343]